jgi:hypothetical protein
MVRFITAESGSLPVDLTLLGKTGFAPKMRIRTQKQCLRIRDIKVRIRIWIIGSVPLTEDKKSQRRRKIEIKVWVFLTIFA